MIREANQKDCQNLVALSIQVWLHSYATEGVRSEISNYVLTTFTVQYFTDLLADPNTQILVHVKENHLLGFIAINLESCFNDKSNGYEIATLYVQEHFHGNGIGQNLLHATKSKFGDKFWLSTWVQNTRSIRFYKKFGFKDIGSVDFKLGNELFENRVLAFKPT